MEDNDNGKSLHSGTRGPDRRFWAYQVLEDQAAAAFYLTLPDGDQGIPGEVHICVTYRLTDEGGLRISYSAVPEQDTLINLTNHTYFNLDGHASGNCLDTRVQILADQVVELNPLTGLVDSPGQTDDGVSGKCLINPSLKPVTV